MTEKRQESPVKQSSHGLAFRFRANEEELEELSIEEEKPEEQNSLQENISKLFEQLPRKLLTKNHSQSDSEDTSESSKLSEWWKEADESRYQRFESIVGAWEAENGVGRKFAVNSVPDIKVAQGRTSMEVRGEVESGVEAGEEFADVAGSSTTPLPSPSSETSPSIPPSASSSDDLPASNRASVIAKALKGVATYCIPVVIAAWFNVSEFWSGVLFGVCFVGLSRVLWQLIEAVISGPCDEPEKGPFKLPQYKLLPPLKTPAVTQDKRGCFNVYNLPYNPDTYSVSQTKPVCLELEGSLLRITRVKTRLAKRAHFNQADYETDQSKKAEYDLTKCTVQLLPEGLARKRWYSKKYPIAVNLGDGAIVSTCADRFHAGYDGAFFSASDKESDDSDTEGGDETSQTIKLASPILYLFARCDRDKEDWYRRLLAAATPPIDESTLAVTSEEADQSISTCKSEDNPSVDSPNLSVFEDYVLTLSKFVDMPPELMGANLLQGEAELEMDVDCLEVQWLNAFIGRILFDMFRSPYWLNKIQEKLQKKLSTLKRPEYVDEMEITELELGREGPTIHRVSRPFLDERGLWFDLDLSYRGTMCCTIQTKLNLMRAQREEKPEDESSQPDKMKSPVFDSELEDTAESSTDEEDDEDSNNSMASPVREPEILTPTKSKKKVKTSNNFLRFVENVAKSKAFQHVAQTKMIQKVIEGVSQTKLQLHVKVNGIVGTMAVNIPPPPSDRLWYGFRGMPKIWLKAKPNVGEWNVKFSHVTNWIERKLIKEFQHRLVLPNMKFIVLPGPLGAVVPKNEEIKRGVSKHSHKSIWEKRMETVHFRTMPLLYSPLSGSLGSSLGSLFEKPAEERKVSAGNLTRKSVDFDKIRERLRTLTVDDGSSSSTTCSSVKSGDFELSDDMANYFLDALESYIGRETNGETCKKEPEEDPENYGKAGASRPWEVDID